MLEGLTTLEEATPRHYAWVADLIRPWLGKSVLEVASGIGVLSKHIAPAVESLVVSDYEPAFLETLRERFGHLSHVDYRLIDLTKRPFDVGDREIDTVVCLNALEHMEFEDDVLGGFADLLPVGGRVVVQVPQHAWLYGALDQLYGHYRRYSRADLERVLTRAGFRVREVLSFNPYLVPGWFVNGRILRQQRLSATPLRLYDACVPLLRKLGPLSFAGGITLIAHAEKR